MNGIFEISILLGNEIETREREMRKGKGEEEEEYRFPGGR